MLIVHELRDQGLVRCYRGHERTVELFVGPTTVTLSNTRFARLVLSRGTLADSVNRLRTLAPGQALELPAMIEGQTVRWTMSSEVIAYHQVGTGGPHTRLAARIERGGWPMLLDDLAALADGVSVADLAIPRLPAASEQTQLADRLWSPRRGLD